MNDTNEKQYNVEAVKSWLLEFREREQDIQDQLDRLDVIETKITSIGSLKLSDTPKSPSPFHDRVAYLVAAKADLEKDIGELQEEQKRKRKDIEKVIKKLKKSEEKAVIRARYLDCAFYHENALSSWYDVTDTLFGGRENFLESEDSYLRRVHKIHNSALINMARYLEESPSF